MDHSEENSPHMRNANTFAKTNPGTMETNINMEKKKSMTSLDDAEGPEEEQKVYKVNDLL